jgi:hypothetical protein
MCCIKAKFNNVLKNNTLSFKVNRFADSFFNWSEIGRQLSMSRFLFFIFLAFISSAHSQTLTGVVSDTLNTPLKMPMLPQNHCKKKYL